MEPLVNLARRHLLGMAFVSWPLVELSEPFYPRQKPLDQDNDLVLMHGHTKPAQGRVIHLVGTVRDRQGRGVRGARVEIWQADHLGRYRDGLDRQDPDFQGFGAMLTDRDGGYRFRTVKPGIAYGRPPQIHMQVRAAKTGITTRLHFPDEPVDPYLPTLIAVLEAPAVYRFDVALPG
jgi:protocatechuate 3,4-dioxygenase, beta subunit